MDGMFHPGMGPCDGLCWVGAQIRLDDVKDGTSHTIAFTESLRGPGDTQTASAMVDMQVYRAQVAAENAVALANLADTSGFGAVTYSGWDGTRLSFWLRGSEPTGPVMNGRFAPNSKIPDLTGKSSKATAARSRHPGGVNACFCDGSVRFIGESIDASDWHALWTRDGGETIIDY
jgi:prepilin-type processing-associated H-X9-DG protein